MKEKSIKWIELLKKANKNPSYDIFNLKKKPLNSLENKQDKLGRIVRLTREPIWLYSGVIMSERISEYQLEAQLV